MIGFGGCQGDMLRSKAAVRFNLVAKMTMRLPAHHGISWIDQGCCAGLSEHAIIREMAQAFPRNDRPALESKVRIVALMVNTRASPREQAARGLRTG
ncbi:protein of unknown function [Bradyrhizobium vignae]|uniref:Uncharacterized protein n=1 Tax=Bradyrhizobium vignae TaxID=1549949 RepID=A0A2U3PUC3_9BRAD|nr:protein of unknown function [Bradyrhizobium vignae]